MSALNGDLFDRVADGLSNGNLQDAYDHFLHGVRTKPHALAVRCLRFRLWAAVQHGPKAADQWTIQLIHLAEANS